ncbi:MAG: H-X9-DG-CTERM domain-containing protein [Capsulimonas sp.]|uniref:H-X9-DG-CTERM domain-containing protein n=1 Tax=Capsulimonas sp. TaxID=2494211 RepID=UPI003265BC69
MKRNAAMTIVELIIVLIIVAVMAAILFPVFAKSHTPRRSRYSCTSNLKQIELGVLQYLQDNDGAFPARQARAGAHGELVSWRSLVYPYIKNTRVFQCPTSQAADTADIEHDGFTRSYVVNSTTVHKRGSSGPFSDAYGGKSNMNEIANPARVITMAESTAAFNDINLTFPDAFTHEFHAENSVGALFASHSGGSNYGFGDGHVKYLRPADTLNDRVNMWTSDNSNFSEADNTKALQVLHYAENQGKEDRQ